MDELMDIIIETEFVHDSFRLWMTTEVHKQFPITLLQMSIKFANEPPQGLRAGLKRTYGGESRNPSKFMDVLMLTLCFLKALWKRNSIGLVIASGAMI